MRKFCAEKRGDKETEKLRSAFREFIEAVKKGVKMHGEWVATKTEFIPLQVQLESSLETFVDQLTPYLN